MKYLYLVSIFILYNISMVTAQSAGPYIPLTYGVSGTGASWGNLGGIAAVDNNPAYADLYISPTCTNLQCYYSNVASFTGFGFNIPSTAVITGIQLDIMQRVSSPGGGIHDSTLTLSVLGVSYGSDYASDSNWFDTPHVHAYGGPTDTWGYSWTPAEINDPDFGFLYRVTNTSYDQPASVDHLTMTVFYQPGTGIASHVYVPWEIGVANNFLYVNGSLRNAKESCHLEVSNILGEMIFQSSIESNNEIISFQKDISSLTRGTYIVKLFTGSGVMTKKIILSR